MNKAVPGSPEFIDVSKASKLAFLCATLQELYSQTNEEYLIKMFERTWDKAMTLVDALVFYCMISEHAKSVKENMK